MAFIECRDAAFGYEGKAAVEQLNFKVEEGNYLCVVGENGSGKKYADEGNIRSDLSDEGRINLSGRPEKE